MMIRQPYNMFSSFAASKSMRACSALLLSALFTLLSVGAVHAQTQDIDTFDISFPTGLFSFDGNTNTVAVTTTVIMAGDPNAVPNQIDANGVLMIDYAVAAFGGVTHGFEAPRNWSNKAGFSFWFRGTASDEFYQIEVFDNRADPAIDTAERFEYRFKDTVDDWRHFTIPFSAFERATDYQPDGAPNDGLNLTSVWGYSIVLPQHTDTVYLDAVALTDDFVLADYENGTPDGGFTFQDGASTISQNVITASPDSAISLSGQSGDNDVLEISIGIDQYGGIGRSFEPTPQDWSEFEGLGFWFYGSGSGERFQIELHDNRADGSTSSERYEYRFIDDFSGWQEFRVPFSSFVRSTDFQPDGVPDDGLTLTEIWEYDIVLPQTNTTVYVDNFALLADAPDEIDNGGEAVVVELGSAYPPGYYDFNGPESTLVITTTTIAEGDPLELPDQLGDMTVLSLDYNISDYGGFAIVTNAESQDWRGHTGVGFWFYGGNTGGTFQVEIFDNRSDPDPAVDTFERYEYRFVDDFSGWRRMSIAFDDFFRATDFQPVGAPEDGLNLNEVWGYGFTLPASTGQAYISEISLVDEAPVEMFEGDGLPSGYYQFSDPTSSATGQPLVLASGDANARPLQGAENSVLAIDFDIETYGGVAVKYPSEAEDWSRYEGVSFWLRGNNAGDRIQFELFDNRSTPDADDSERYEYRITDHGPTWRKITIPFTDFVRAVDFQPETAPNDGLNLTEIWGFEVGLPQSAGTIMIDQLSVFNGAGELGFVVKSSVYLPTVSR